MCIRWDPEVKRNITLPLTLPHPTKTNTELNLETSLFNLQFEKTSDPKASWKEHTKYALKSRIKPPNHITNRPSIPHSELTLYQQVPAAGKWYVIQSKQNIIKKQNTSNKALYTQQS